MAVLTPSDISIKSKKGSNTSGGLTPSNLGIKGGIKKKQKLVQSGPMEGFDFSRLKVDDMDDSPFFRNSIPSSNI